MHYKTRTKSKELVALEYLDKRMALPEQERNYYLYLKKGFEGEVMFDKLTEKLQVKCLVLNDLLLKINKTTFQIDTLTISSNKIYFYEVKNLEGDHFYENDKLFKFPKVEIKNPLNQMRRAETLLKQLILSLGYNFPVEGLVVFINPEFTLYESPRNYPFLFPTQINRYLRQFETINSKLTNKNKSLADKLISLHILNTKENKYSNLPNYRLDQLRKGITCASCNSFSVTVIGRNCVCEECEHAESLSLAVMRNVKEFKILFPEEKITTNIIYDWCNIIDSKKRVQRMLDSNFKIVSKRKWTYYE